MGGWGWGDKNQIVNSFSKQHYITIKEIIF